MILAVALISVLLARDVTPAHATSATLTVNTAADNETFDSVLTLREALNLATGIWGPVNLSIGECAQVSNSTFSVTCSTPDTIGSGSGDLIQFSASFTITLGSALPTLSTGTDFVYGNFDDRVIGGGTSSFDCFRITSGSNYIQNIRISGCNDAIEISGTATGNLVYLDTLVSNATGVRMTGENVESNYVKGSLIGTDGTSPLANGTGVLIEGGADFNEVGGVYGAERNIISGNTNEGVRIKDFSTVGNLVVGNYIGTTVAGTADMGNGTYGVSIESSAAGNTVGGTTSAERNIISGNDLGSGVRIDGSSTNGNLVKGNYIGTAVDGTTDLGNSYDGVLITGGAASNIIGGTAAGAGNVISGNNSNGVYIYGAGVSNRLEGNYIGTNAPGTAGLQNDGNGVFIENTTSTVVGGTAAGAGNVISGNGIPYGSHGIRLYGSTTSTVIEGNKIGTNAAGTSAIGNAGAGVMIDGSSTTGNSIGGGTGTTPGGSCTGACNLISGNTVNGVDISGAGSTANVVAGNFIGVDVTGTLDRGNSGRGVYIHDSATANIVGGSSADRRNVISGNNTRGVEILGAGVSSNTVKGNYIGTNSAGTVALGNTSGGVVINNSASGNTIGGSAAGAGNVISGNDGGIAMANGASNNVIQGNLIGTNPSGSAGIANTLDGIQIHSGANNNTIGGIAAGQANTIAFNGGSGVCVLEVGTTPIGESIRGNSIHDNGGLGIDLTPSPAGACDGLTNVNDGLGDLDTGPNNLMNFPVVTSVVYNGIQTTITGTLATSGLATATCTAPVNDCVDVYSTPAGDPEGRAYLGQATPNSSGDWTLIYSGAPAYSTFTATATDSSDSTSEFTPTVYTGSVGAGMALNTIARQGQATPIGGTFSTFGRASLPTIGGDVYFWATLTGGSASSAIFGCHITAPAAADCVTSGNVITKVAAVGDATPVGGTFASFSVAPGGNAQGDVVFWASVTGGSASQGFFRCHIVTPTASDCVSSGNTITKIAAVGDTTPIFGTTYTGFTQPLGTPVAVTNESRDISFFASLSSGGQGIFLYTEATAAITKVAATGDVSPTGGTFTGFYNPGGYGTVPVLSPTGQVAFWSLVSDAAGQGIFLRDHSVLSKVAAVGDTIPGGGATYTSFGQVPVASAEGLVVFFAALSSGTASCGGGASCGIFTKSSAGTAMVLRSGDAGPTGVGGTITNIGSVPVINGIGEITDWIATTNGFSSQTIVRLGSSTNVASIGNATPIGGTFSTFIDAFGFATVPLINSLGQIVTYGGVSGGSGTSGIFITASPTSGSPTVHLGPVEGATAPGTGGGTFGPAFDLAMNSAGQAVFQDSIVGGTSNSGVYMFFAGNPAPGVTTTGTQLTPLAVQGGAAPGGGTYSTFGPPIVNDSGTTTVRSVLASGAGEGLYLFFAGSSPPPPQKKVGTEGTYASFGNPALNNLGDIAAPATLDSGSRGVYLFFAGNPTPQTAGVTGGMDDASETFCVPANCPSGTFGQPSINLTASTAFTGKLGTGSQEGLYLFFAGSSTPHRLAKTGTAIGGFTFTDFGDPVVNDSGSVIVSGAEGGTQGLYLFTNTAGTPTVTKLADLSTSTGLGGSFTAFTSPVIAPGTTVPASIVSRAAITGGSATEGLFLFFAGSPLTAPSKIVGPGNSPVENSNITFAGTAPIFPYHAMNTNLSIVFVAKTTGQTGSSQGVFFASLDQDNDAIPDGADNCPLNSNATQTNTDQARKTAGYNVVADGLGDACDTDRDGDGILNTNEPIITGHSCDLEPDCDGDTYLDGADNCPTFSTGWTVPVGDTDCDGYPNTVLVAPRGPESTLGTDATDRCSNTTTMNDESLDAWPVDNNDNRLVNGSDILAYNNVFGQPTTNPPVNIPGQGLRPVARFDLNASGLVNGADILQFNAFFGKTCTP